MRKSLVALAGLVLGVGAGVTVVQSPALADFPNNCPYGTGCIWTGPNGTGQEKTYAFSVYGTTCHALPAPFADNVHSGVATYGSGYYYSLYSNSDCTGNNVPSFPTGVNYGFDAYSIRIHQ
jgi:hypothetical protein